MDQQPGGTQKSSSSTLLKVFLIGCVGLILLAAVVFVGGFLWTKHWVTQKAKKFENLAGGKESEYGQKASELEKEYPFTAPADGIINEDQLTRFLSVRKAMYGVYEKYHAEFDRMNKSQNPNVSDAMKGLDVINEVRMAQIQELEKQKMSKDEYDYIVSAVYQTWLADSEKESTHGSNYSTAAGGALQKQIDEIDKQLNDPNTPESTKKMLQPMRDSLVAQKNVFASKEAQSAEAALQVPQQNLELFKKHQDEIKQYSMGGLEFLGL
jgi:hypothetical protein